MILRTHYSGDINPEMAGSEILLAGWAHEIRDLGGICFLVLRDRKGLAQVTLVKKIVDTEMFKKVRSISRESVVQVRGEIKSESKAPHGFEILPKEINVLDMAKVPLPLDPTEKVECELDTRLDSRFMDIRRPSVLSIFEIVSSVLHAIRDFFYSQNITEVFTPKIVAAATEGGTDLFPISYFEKEAFLNQSPQLYKQMLMAAGMDRVFEIGPIFRAEEHDTRKHLNEAISIDIEVSFADENDVMAMLENAIASAYKHVKENCQRQLEILNLDLVVPNIPFKKITYTEAIELAKNDKSVPIQWGDDLDTETEKFLGGIIGEHYFLTEWPSSIKPYYTLQYEDRPKICRGFDLMHPRMELASGAQRVHDLQMLTQRIKDKGLEPESFEFYLDAFKYGMPPHSGWGLGLSRLVMTMLDLENIRDAVIFPRDRRRLVP
ncbi:MAG: aspartate--tRNA(Asn) ligase [Methanotrichaceae archaeon]|nr:aspartate--tRNA(Asn) ligase [Methanotrichaceae archaeon]